MLIFFCHIQVLQSNFLIFSFILLVIFFPIRKIGCLFKVYQFFILVLPLLFCSDFFSFARDDQTKKVYFGMISKINWYSFFIFLANHFCWLIPSIFAWEYRSWVSAISINQVIVPKFYFLLSPTLLSII